MHKTTIWCLHRGFFPPTLTNRMTAEHMLGQTATLWRGSWRMLLLMSTDGADKRIRVSPHILGDGHDGRWLVGIMHHAVKKNERIGKGGKFASQCQDSWRWRTPSPVEHDSRWAANERQPAAVRSQRRAKCASPWQTTITFKLTQFCVIKYNNRGHLLNALAHISVEFREHCVAACWTSLSGNHLPAWWQTVAAQYSKGKVNFNRHNVVA